MQTQPLAQPISPLLSPLPAPAGAAAKPDAEPVRSENDETTIDRELYDEVACTD